MTKEQLKFLDSGCLGRGDKLISLFSSSLIYRKNAGKTAASHITHAVSGERIEVSVNHYIYKHPVVLKIAAYIESNLYHDVAGAYVHGSTATDEMIPYSDFDGLIIVKDEVLKNKSRLLRFAKHLKNTRIMMHELDAFQHHGWLVFSESDLNQYNSCVFPYELFHYAAAILDKGHSFSLSVTQCSHQQVLQGLASVVIKKQMVPHSLYGIKSLLSEFMLLPAVYIQAKTGNGIFKKFSFNEAAADFTTGEWQCMNEVSEIRKNWNFKGNAEAELRALRLSPIKQLSEKLHAPAPDVLRTRVTALLPQMQQLAATMKSKINS